MSQGETWFKGVNFPVSRALEEGDESYEDPMPPSVALVVLLFLSPGHATAASGTASAAAASDIVFKAPVSQYDDEAEWQEMFGGSDNGLALL